MNKCIAFFCLLSLVVSGSAILAQKTLPSEDKMTKALEKVSIQGNALTGATTMLLEKTMIQQGLQILEPQEVREASEAFKSGMIFIYQRPKQILVLMEMKDAASASKFLGYEEKVLRKKDEVYSQLIIEKEYKKYPDMQILICRKTIETMGQKQKVSVVVAVKENLLLESNLLDGEYTDQELLEYCAAIWKAVESQ